MVSVKPSRIYKKVDSYIWYPVPFLPLNLINERKLMNSLLAFRLHSIPFLTLALALGIVLALVVVLTTIIA